MKTMWISLLIFSFLWRKKRMWKKTRLNNKKISFMKSCTSLVRTSSKQRGLTKIQFCPTFSSSRWQVDGATRAWFPTRNWQVWYQRREVPFLCQTSKVILIAKVDLVISKTSTSDRSRKTWFQPKIYRRRLSSYIMLLWFAWWTLLL